MKVLLIALLSSCVLVVGSIGVAAPEQGQRPGEISPPNVWVQNRGPGEAIPVNLIDAAPVRVQIADPFTGRPDNVVGTRASRQNWDYTQVLIGENDNAVALLNSAGANGWEATGLQFATSRGTAVVLKRPR